MKKATWLFVLLVALIFVAVGCGSSTADNTGTAVQAVTQNSPDTSAPLMFSGTGTEATKKFALKAGTIKVSFKHTGTGFAVFLQDSAGNDVGKVARSTGNTDSSIELPIQTAGDYRLDVQEQNENGTWSISIQPQ